MNPEFRRSVWLELTAQRLVVMPAVIGALLFLLYLLSGELGEGLMTAALWMYGALALLWGTRTAAEAVSTEIVARTWDGQRMSALGPWGMAWAKLFGSTVYVWYGCAMLAAAYLLLNAIDGETSSDVIARLVLVTAAAIVAHAVSLLASLHLVRRRASEIPVRGAGLFTLGLVAAAPFLLLGNAAAEAQGELVWFGAGYDALGFAVATSVAFAAWSVVGVYMLMRLELQRRNSPLVWLGFVVFVTSWAAGLADDSRPGLAVAGIEGWGSGVIRLVVALAVATALYYVTLLVEPKDPVTFRRLVREARAHRPDRVAELLPRWAITFALAAVLGGALLAAVAASGIGTGAVWRMLGFVVGLTGFMIRDAALVLVLNLSARPRRADAAGFVYLVVLYTLLPGLLVGLGHEHLQSLVLPSWDSGPAAALPAVVQALGVSLVVAARWRAHRARAGGAPTAPLAV